jgi:hypothetical protein
MPSCSNANAYHCEHFPVTEPSVHCNPFLHKIFDDPLFPNHIFSFLVFHVFFGALSKSHSDLVLFFRRRRDVIICRFELHFAAKILFTVLVFNALLDLRVRVPCAAAD